MKFFAVLFPIASLASTEKGTCVNGLDPVDLSQECLGRCHIYHAGEYGACFSYQFTEQDISGECGSSPSTACKSTFNVAWDPEKSNCGNCYLVELPYTDGTVKQTYIKVVDTNGSETKFEMGQRAWQNLCPYVCAGTGDCGHSVTSCQYGVLPENPAYGGPMSCAVQHAPIRFKRVDCEGSAPAAPTIATTVPSLAPAVPTVPVVPLKPVVPSAVPIAPVAPVAPSAVPIAPVAPVAPTAVPIAPVVPVAPVVPTAVPIAPVVPVAPVAPTAVPIAPVVPVAPVVPTAVPIVPVVPVAPVVPTAVPIVPVVTAEVIVPVAVSECKGGIGHSTNPDWALGCQNLCEYYYSTPTFCTGVDYTTGEGLIGCIQKLHSYCEKV